MARLSDRWLIQQIGDDDGTVIVFEEGTEAEVARWKAGDRASIGEGLNAVHASDQLTDDEKAMAVFWAGYFYAHAANGGPPYQVVAV